MSCYGLITVLCDTCHRQFTEEGGGRRKRRVWRVRKDGEEVARVRGGRVVIFPVTTALNQLCVSYKLVTGGRKLLLLVLL